MDGGSEEDTMGGQYQEFDYEAERRRAAVSRDYTTPAILTLVLYFVFWIPGLIANIVYFMQASQDEKITGHSPQGKGCLLAMLIVWVGVPIIGIGLFCAFFVVAGAIGSASSTAN